MRYYELVIYQGKLPLKPNDIIKKLYDIASYVYLTRNGCYIYIYGLWCLFIGTSGIDDIISFALTPAYTNY